MFRRALHEDFAYFPGDYIEQVSKDNSYLRFLRATFSSNRIMLGLYSGNKLVGYAIADTSLATDSDIFWFYVVPECRGKGYGKLFFEALLNRINQSGCKHVYLMTHNQRDFYRAFEFKLVSENTKLFEGITMYEMAKDIG